MLEAPTAGSVLLGWYFIKNGGDTGSYVLQVPLFPSGTLRFLPLILLVISFRCFIAVHFLQLGKLILRRTIAYSSVWPHELNYGGVFFQGSLLGLQGSSVIYA